MHNAEFTWSGLHQAGMEWHERFVPPSLDGVPCEIFRAGTKEIAAAKRIGAQIIESFWFRYIPVSNQGRTRVGGVAMRGGEPDGICEELC